MSIKINYQYQIKYDNAYYILFEQHKKKNCLPDIFVQLNKLKNSKLKFNFYNIFMNSFHNGLIKFCWNKINENKIYTFFQLAINLN